jgi:hypothetical protein
VRGPPRSRRRIRAQCYPAQVLGLIRDILLAGFFLLPLIGLFREVARRRRVVAVQAFREVGHLLRDPVVDPARSTVSGLAHGLRTTFRMTTRDSDSGSEPWTEVDVLLPTGTPLAMELRPRTEDEDDRIARGLAVDVELDDPAFGPLFVVEAVPADVVRALLDHRVRARLVALYPCEVTGSVQGLRFAKRGWQERGREARDRRSRRDHCRAHGDRGEHGERSAHFRGRSRRRRVPRPRGGVPSRCELVSPAVGGGADAPRGEGPPAARSAPGHGLRRGPVPGLDGGGCRDRVGYPLVPCLLAHDVWQERPPQRQRRRVQRGHDPLLLEAAVRQLSGRPHTCGVNPTVVVRTGANSRRNPRGTAVAPRLAVRSSLGALRPLVVVSGAGQTPVLVLVNAKL